MGYALKVFYNFEKSVKITNAIVSLLHFFWVTNLSSIRPEDICTQKILFQFWSKGKCEPALATIDRKESVCALEIFFRIVAKKYSTFHFDSSKISIAGSARGFTFWQRIGSYFHSRKIFSILLSVKEFLWCFPSKYFCAWILHSVSTIYKNFYLESIKEIPLLKVKLKIFFESGNKIQFAVKM
jgi:hypothetical protein